jgi:dipeptidyl aminopeptidase/acylaminoacyl peptidase
MNNTYGQKVVEPTSTKKKVIDSLAIKMWPSLGFQVALSNDGKYLMYKINNKPVGNNTIVLKSTDKLWTKEFPSASDAFISNNNDQFIFLRNDSLFIENLGLNNQREAIEVKSVKYPYDKKGRWLAWLPKTATKELILKDLSNGAERIFKGTIDYKFDAIGNVLLIIKEYSNEKRYKILQYVNLVNGTVKSIWADSTGDDHIDLQGLIIDNRGQLVFVSNHEDKLTDLKKPLLKTIWYYNSEMDQAQKRLNSHSKEIEDEYTITGYPRISKNGRWIFFDVEKRLENKGFDPNAAKVNVWSYKDLILQPEQIRQIKKEGGGLITYTYCMSVDGGKIIRLNQENEEISTWDPPGDFTVIKASWLVEPWWNLTPQPHVYLVSLKDGTRRILDKESNNLYFISFSPGGKWLIYYNRKKDAFFSFNLQTSVCRNITASIHTDFKSEYGRALYHLPVAGPAGWLPNDSGVLLYDNFDIWQVILNDNKIQVSNFTNGYGLKNHLKLRLIDGLEQYANKNAFRMGQKLLITAFSPINKYNGFFEKVLGVSGDPKLLYLGPYTFYRTPSQKPHFYSFDDGMMPLKADSADVWVVKRQSDIESPNYYLTRNFKDFSAITNLQPQGDYNWIKADLVEWRQLDGTKCQGILYKPEDFDSTKKYPLLFNYYDQLSHRRYEFPKPDFTQDNINIPWFVSRGYLVFTPDIHFQVASKTGRTPGECAYNSVISAVKFLSKFSYIDTQRLGIQGHSFGGGETIYLITRTHIFAAANEVAGHSDLISEYLTLVPFLSPIEHYPNQTIFELGQGAIGATLWERPDLYLKESSVLYADKVTTPLLIVHNEKDNNIQWRQAIELYIALRRLGKKSWMLQYDDGKHSLRGKDAVDFTIRLTQFFDHYLKFTPAPIWMTKGIPASLKGIEEGYELDSTGSCGDDCKVCKKFDIIATSYKK